MKMSIVVTKCSPELVRPSSEPAPGPTGNIHLSWFDKFLGSVAVTVLLVFDKPIQGNPVDTIRRALSQALVHYYPISGRLADGGEAITCSTGGQSSQGVLFAGASASCAFDDLRSSPSTGLLEDMFLHYPGDECGDADALLLMQVTEFSCGGFAVGVTWNHVLADGAGMGQFLQALGELARGVSPPSVVPVRSDDSVSLAARPQGGVAAMEFPPAGFTDGMAFLDFTVPRSFVDSVKAALPTCTLFEVVLALLWRCRARAVISGADAEDPRSASSVVFGYNMRGLVGAPGGYYGNCLVQVPVVATNAEVAHGDIEHAVKLIQIAKKKVAHHREDTSANGTGGDPVPAVQVGYNTILVSSWRNLGLEAPDFGGGTPARVMWYMSQVLVPFLVICPPCKGTTDRVNVLGYVGKKEHVDAFMLELEMPTTTSGQHLVVDY